MDTNVALLGLTTPERLSLAIRTAAEQGPLYLSVVSYWEVLLKSMKGNLDVGDPRQWWTDTLEGFGATPLMLHAKHLSALYELEPIHQDPFDRVLIAQAMVEEVTFLTLDGIIPKYSSPRFSVIS